MRFFRLFVFVIALTAFGALTAQAAEISTGGVFISVGGQERLIQADDKGFIRLGEPINVFIDDILAARIDQLGAALDSDPFIAYGIAVTNFTPGPLAFGFGFFSPYVGGPYDTLDSSHSSSVTDSGSAPDGLITVTPLLALIHVPSIDGVPVPAAALGVGCALVVTPGDSKPCDAGGTSVPVATLAAGMFDVFVGFTLSGDDIYTGNGRVELKKTSVPEPTSFVLIGLGLSAVALIRRRHRS